MAMRTGRTDERRDLHLPTPGNWVIDPAHSEIHFIVRHMMISKVRGRFGEFSGSFTIDEVPERSCVDVVIKAASIDTGDPQRDGHLRSPEFLDAERYPEIRFRSTSVRPIGAGCGELDGDVTVKGITKAVSLRVQFNGEAVDPWGNTRAGFAGTMEIDREDFGLTWNQALEAGGVLLGREITFELDVEAVRQSDGDS
jgi:polyisoprenoid-binding protein YceI